MLDRSNELNAWDRDHFFHPSTHMGTHARGESASRTISSGDGVYITDVNAAKGKLEAVQIPDDLEPKVVYGIAIVSGTDNQDESQEFIDGLLNGPGQQDLQQAGFGPPPGS